MPCNGTCYQSCWKSRHVAPQSSGTPYAWAASDRANSDLVAFRLSLPQQKSSDPSWHHYSPNVHVHCVAMAQYRRRTPITGSDSFTALVFLHTTAASKRHPGRCSPNGPMKSDSSANTCRNSEYSLYSSVCLASCLFFFFLSLCLFLFPFPRRRAFHYWTSSLQPGTLLQAHLRHPTYP